MDLNLDNIKFLNESVAVNEGILFSTEGGREKVSKSIARIDKYINIYLTCMDNNTKIIYDTYRKFFVGDISLNLKKKFSILENAITNLKEGITDANNAINEIKKEYKGNIFKDIVKRKFFNRADFKSPIIAKEYADFIKKCSPGGEYYNKCVDLYNIIDVNLVPLFNNSVLDKIRSARLEFERGSKEVNALNEFINYFNGCVADIRQTIGALNYISNDFKPSKKK